MSWSQGHFKQGIHLESKNFLQNLNADPCTNAGWDDCIKGPPFLRIFAPDGLSGQDFSPELQERRFPVHNRNKTLIMMGLGAS